MRIIEFILSNEGLMHKANYFWSSASSPPQADAPPNFIKVMPIHESIIPVFHYSNIPAKVERVLEWSKSLS